MTLRPLANRHKYRPFVPISLHDRTWPGQTIQRAPTWCSVDLRDGNQALIEPMNLDRKMRKFRLLCQLGFREIEIGFPSASQTEYDFVRLLIEQRLIPDHVTVQVLTQARNDLIERTFESLRGAPRAIVHFYNSTSTLQREVVFRQDRAGVKRIALRGAEIIAREAARYPETDWSFEYSPESFTGTELDYAAEVCDSVYERLTRSSRNPIILNLPATVEMATPNVYADQIEYMCRQLKPGRSVVVSLHPHNDRGTAVAAAELGLMAGADRIEGTLFGNGERTGNVDLVTLALNLYSQGIDPELNFSDINHVIREYEHCTQLPVHPRHPYAGDLVFTAFSGSHQDAINKGFRALPTQQEGLWAVPYLPVDPVDLGRDYEAIVRINSQSGKGGLAFVLEKNHGLKLPRRLQMDFSRRVQQLADRSSQEIGAGLVWDVFKSNYLEADPNLKYVNHVAKSLNEGQAVTDQIEVDLLIGGQQIRISSDGNGPINAFVNGLNGHFHTQLKIGDYQQQALGSGSEALSSTFVEMELNGRREWGVGINASTLRGSLEAIVVALKHFLGALPVPRQSLPTRPERR
jgi:2-isopropylmalate synthase